MDEHNVSPYTYVFTVSVNGQFVDFLMNTPFCTVQACYQRGSKVGRLVIAISAAVTASLAALVSVNGKPFLLGLKAALTALTK